VVCIGSCSSSEDAVEALSQTVLSAVAPLHDVPKPLGEQAGGQTRSSQEKLTEKLKGVNQALRGVHPKKVSAALDKHFTSKIWEQWTTEMKTKALSKDTAEGVLNSYLCAGLKDPPMLVAVIDWVRQKMKLAPHSSGQQGESAMNATKAETVDKQADKAEKAEQKSQDEAKKV
jgi:hypothetical protein